MTSLIKSDKVGFGGLKSELNIADLSKKVIIRYLREDDGNVRNVLSNGIFGDTLSVGRPIGVVLAVKINDQIHLGWAILNKLDKFSRRKMLEIAFNRAILGSSNVKIPNRKIVYKNQRMALREIFEFNKEKVLKAAETKLKNLTV